MDIPRVKRVRRRVKRSRFQFSDKLSIGAILLSLAAFLFTLYSFYYANLRVDNEVVITNPLTRFANTGAFEFDVLFHNIGNKDQAVVRLQAEIIHSGSNGNIFDNEIEPFVVKANEIVQRKVKLQVPVNKETPKPCVIPQPKKGSYELNLTILTSDSSVMEKEKKIKLGSLKIDDALFDYNSYSVQNDLHKSQAVKQKTKTGMAIHMSGISGIEERPVSWRIISSLPVILEMTYGNSISVKDWMEHCAKNY